MAGAFVFDRLVGFAGGFHHGFRFGNGGVHAVVVAAVEAIDRAFDFGDVFGVFRTGAIEDEGGFQFRTVDGEAEGLRTAPAKTGHGEFAVGGGKFFGVIGHGIEIGGDLVGVQFVNPLGGVIYAGVGVGVAAVWAGAGQEIGRDGDVTGGGKFIGGTAGPIGQAFVFMDDDDGGGGIFDFGIDDEAMDDAGAVFDVGPFAVARGFVEFGLGPVLGIGGEAEGEQ